MSRFDNVDPSGRLDVAAARVAETFVRATVEPAFNGLPLWNRGLGEVVEQVIAEHIPSVPVSALDIAKALGLVAGRVKGNR